MRMPLLCRVAGINKGPRQLEAEMQVKKQVPVSIADNGKVRLGGNSPSLPIRVAPASVADSGKVRLGGNSPSLPMRIAPASVADNGKVRLGGLSPAL